MKFDDLDKRMRVYETSLDQKIIPGLYIVVRLDGRGFTKLTKVTLPLERPFDIRFRDSMIKTVEHLMNCGFRIIFGYTESDEISLLFHLEEDVFDRKLRKIISVLSGEASGKFSLEMGIVAAFDCRICPLPNQEIVIDYFMWRSEDAFRNSLNSYCYWKLREDGKLKNQATDIVSKLSTSAKNELLFNMNINFNDLPAWQKRGIGFYYNPVVKKSINLLTGDEVESARKILITDLNLPLKEDYCQMLRKIMNDNIEITH